MRWKKRGVRARVSSAGTRQEGGSSNNESASDNEGASFLSTNTQRRHTVPSLENLSIADEAHPESRPHPAFLRTSYPSLDRYSLRPDCLVSLCLPSLHFSTTMSTISSLSGCTTCLRIPGAGVKLSRCEHCRLASYCSKDCQKLDWPTHR